MSKLKTPSVLFDMLNSFVCLARLLNLSHASEELGFTRQTIKRHISDLESQLGRRLFELANRKYILTDAGREALPGARLLLLEAHSWMNGFSDKQNSLTSSKMKNDPNFTVIQQHPISALNKSGPKMLKNALLSWVQASGKSDYKTLKEMQSYAVNFRKQDKFWICNNIGSNSSMASWLGKDQVASATGELINESPITGNYVNDAIQAYDYVYYTGDVVYDHVCAKIPRAGRDEKLQVNYQRLILPCSFPNDETFISSFVFRTNDIVIGNVPRDAIPKMDRKWLMKDE